MDSSDERLAVAQFLDGKDIVFTSEVAFGTWGKRYSDMDRPSWGRLASALKSAGMVKGFVDKHPVWLRA